MRERDMKKSKNAKLFTAIFSQNPLKLEEK